MAQAHVNIENIVASMLLDQDLHLEEIAPYLEGGEYNPEQFPGIIYRVEEPKTAVLIFRDGKIMTTGSKSMDDVKNVFRTVMGQLVEAGVIIEEKPKVQIKNIVASLDLKRELNLNAIAVSLGLDNVEYNPEEFPGLVYRISDLEAVLLLFESGVLVSTGTRKLEVAKEAFQRVVQELKGAGLQH